MYFAISSCIKTFNSRAVIKKRSLINNICFYDYSNCCYSTLVTCQTKINHTSKGLPEIEAENE